MDAKPRQQPIGPPRLFPSLQAGFNTTASHIYLIIFPVILDLLLWLGPQVKIKQIFQPFIDLWITSLGNSGTSDLQAFLSVNQSAIHELLNQVNILTLLRTFPIGIPSLISSSVVENTPFGLSSSIEVPSFAGLVLIIGGLLLSGIIAGGFFFTKVAQASSEEEETYSLALYSSHIIQSILLTMTLITIIVAISIPALIVLTLLGMISAGIAQFGALIVMFFVIWLLLPLVFSPHGIFANRQTAFTSLFTSIRLVRLFIPGTGMFIVVSLLINEGMNVIWHIPQTDSWMTAIAILGHGFIATSLLSASYVYYRGGLRWMNDNLSRLMKTGLKEI